jgi:hypothetical protein
VRFGSDNHVSKETFFNRKVRKEFSQRSQGNSVGDINFVTFGYAELTFGYAELRCDYTD